MLLGKVRLVLHGVSFVWWHSFLLSVFRRVWAVNIIILRKDISLRKACLPGSIEAAALVFEPHAFL